MTQTDPLKALTSIAARFACTDRHHVFVAPGEEESDTDHTVSLALCACAFAEANPEMGLDVGLVAQYALVHDLPEVYAGDAPTLRLPTADQRAVKKEREADAMLRIVGETKPLWWVGRRMASYELRKDREALYVWAFDKMMPKLLRLSTPFNTDFDGMTYQELFNRYVAQGTELMKAGVAEQFPPLWDLRSELLAEVFDKFRAHLPGAPLSEEG